MNRTPIRPDNDDLFARTYHRLKRIGQRSRGRADGETLRTTALVHELYLQIAGNRHIEFRDERGFFTYAAQAIRHLLVDAARRRVSQRACVGRRTTFDATLESAGTIECERMLQIEVALLQLERVDARAAEVVKMHYFVGLTIEQVADSLGLAPRTVGRDWRFAKAFLEDALGR